MQTTKPKGGRLATMDHSGERDGAKLGLAERGKAIKRRRLALGLHNISQFFQATQSTRDRDGNTLDRLTLTKAEAGEAQAWKVDEIEAWLTRFEEETGHDDPTTEQLIKVTLHGVFGVDEVIFEGPATRTEEMAQAVGRVLDRLRASEGKK